jgi:hypothetical protein
MEGSSIVTRLTTALALAAFIFMSSAGRVYADPKGRGSSPDTMSGEAASLLLFTIPGVCDSDNPCFGYEPVYDHKGRPIGRLVPLNGDTAGLNFEPGVCTAGTFPFPGPLQGSTCVVFSEASNPIPGTFIREKPGDVAFTTCHCSVGGVGDPFITGLQSIHDIVLSDQKQALEEYEALQEAILAREIHSRFTLKIRYFGPDAQYPFGHTEFQFVDGKGELKHLKGEGILDFAGNPPITFDYWFGGK